MSVNDDSSLLQHKATQTELKLSNSTPRKVALRRKYNAAVKRAKRTKLQFEKKEKNVEDITFSDFQKLLYKFYPKPLEDFLTAQGNNLSRRQNIVIDIW